MQLEFKIKKGSPLHNVFHYHRGKRFVRFHDTEFRWNPQDKQYIAVEPYGDVNALTNSPHVETTVISEPVGEVKVKNPVQEEVLEAENLEPKPSKPKSTKPAKKAPSKKSSPKAKSRTKK